MKNKKEHYVYLYIDPRDGDVFYVGCGKAYRMMFHIRPSMRRKPTPKNRRINEIMALGIHPMIVVIAGGLTQGEALQIERKTIAFYGKENLTNLTTGGQGCPGTKSFLGRHHTEEAKEKIRQSKIGEKNPMFGKRRSEESLAKFRSKMCGENHPFWGERRPQSTRDKLSESLSGFEWSDEDKEKRSAGMSRVWAERRRTGVGLPRHRKREVTCGGETMSLDDWSFRTGIPKSTIRARLKRGWSVDRALGMESS